MGTDQLTYVCILTMSRKKYIIKAHICFGKGSSLKDTNTAVRTVTANSCVGETEMKDAGLHFVEFHILQRTGRTDSCMVQIKKKHTQNVEYKRGSIQGIVRNTLGKLSWINGVHKY